MPFYSLLFSLRTLVLLLIAACTLVFGSLLLWSGTNILNGLIRQSGTEILTEKVNSILQPVNYRYQVLERIGLEDSAKHLEEIRSEALRDLATFRYKETGSVFVISKNGEIILSQDFSSTNDTDFQTFFPQLNSETKVLSYHVKGRERFSVFRFYRPWDSYVGISMDMEELFAYRDLFVKIVFLLLSAVFLGTFLFSSFIQRYLITPLIRLSRYANEVAKGKFDTPLEGPHILELGALRTDIEQMVATLRQKMEQTTSQLQLIRERERWLDEALRALQESEKKYRAIYNAPNEAILICDPENCTIIDANRGMLSMFGYHHEEIIGMHFGELSSGEPSYTTREAEALITSAVEGGDRILEWMCRRKDGEIFWVEISLQATYLEGKKQVLAVLRNIHARKMAQTELASEKERLAVTLRSIGDGVITTDERGRIVLLNKVAEALTGWRQFEAVGRLFTEVFHIIHLKSGEPCENPVEKVLATGEVVELGDDTVLVSRDGKRRLVADSGAPIRDPQSRVIGAVIVFRDVTEEKRMEEELIKIRKLESVGVLAGGIAHDFNNILVGILGNISLARQCIGDRARAEEMLRNTEKAALRAKDLTTQLLTFSRGGEPVIQTASIVSTITESAEFALRGSNVKISFDIPEDLWLVSADTGQISQVIQNIVLNARQAIPDEGTVEITCRNCTDCGDVPEPLRDKCVRIVISDDGPGIPEEIRGKIFDPYFTTRADGSGLGLSICHSIIMKHRGSISVESEPGRGTDFIILLPVSPEQEIESLPDPDVQAAVGKSARILVMDDDPMIQELSRQMLEFLGHEVVLCDEGKSALDLYEKAMKNRRPFDLVIMDLTIPGGMGGEKAIKELLRMDPGAKAIVSSGYSNDKVMAGYVSHGFKAVIVKPYQMEDLEKIIQQTLRS
ncbi:MAG: hypothetical protein Kow0089_03380 [Desulfobulbaceae bacterium]